MYLNNIFAILVISTIDYKTNYSINTNKKYNFFKKMCNILPLDNCSNFIVI